MDVACWGPFLDRRPAQWTSGSASAPTGPPPSLGRINKDGRVEGFLVPNVKRIKGGMAGMVELPDGVLASGRLGGHKRKE